MRALTRSLLPLFFAMILPAQHRSNTFASTLASMRDQARPLLIFGGAHDTRVQQQYAILADHAQEARERDVRVVLLTTPLPASQPDAKVPNATVTEGEAEVLRKQFGVSPKEFAVILAGKDGGEKLRSHLPLSWSKLAETIDAMPMRREEMKQR